MVERYPGSMMSSAFGRLASPAVAGHGPIQLVPMRGKPHRGLPVSLLRVIVELGHGASKVPVRSMGRVVASSIVFAHLCEDRALRNHACGFPDVRVYPPEAYPGILGHGPASHARIHRRQIRTTFVKALIRSYRRRQRWSAQGSRDQFMD